MAQYAPYAMDRPTRNLSVENWYRKVGLKGNPNADCQHLKDSGISCSVDGSMAFLRNLHAHGDVARIAL